MYSPVHADDGETTPSPTLTPENSPTPTETPTATQTPTSSFTPENTATVTSTSVPTEDAQSLRIPNLRGDYVEDEVLVRFARLTEDLQAASQACFANGQVEVARELVAVGASLLKINQGSVAEIIALAESCPEILFAEPNYQIYALDTYPNDPSWGNQYGLPAIRAPQGWDTTTGSPAVIIAIVDTGVDLSHPDLAGKIVPGYDFVNGDAVPQDDNGHGSHVAGIAAASSNNGVGVAGVSWRARIMPVKVLNASAGGSFANAAAGIIWAADNGAQIINLSLGGSSHSQIFQDAIDYAYSQGVMLIASSGNSGSNFILYPARYPNVMAVGATDSSNVRAGFSNYGTELDVVAPGVDIYSTGIGVYFYDSGTSMSAPYVSGLAAILRGMPGSASPANLAWAIKSTALDLGAAGRDNYYGDGLIQMDAAIQLLWATPTFTPTSTFTLTAAPPSSSAADGRGFWLAPVNPNAAPTSTFTPTPTLAVTFSPTATLFSAPSALPQEDAAPELFALSTPTQRPSEMPAAQSERGGYALPCLGSFLIFFGILLFWFGSRWRRE